MKKMKYKLVCEIRGTTRAVEYGAHEALTMRQMVAVLRTLGLRYELYDDGRLIDCGAGAKEKKGRKKA